MKFSKKASVGQTSVVSEEKPFIRDDRDNKLFKDIQVKDVTKYIRPETVGCWDFDMPCYMAASNMETKFIRVVCNSDKTITDDIKGVVAFKGRGKKIAEASWLGLLNVEREVEGKELLTPDDFTVTDHQKLKYDTEEQALEQAKIILYKNIKKVKLQYGLSNIKLVLGSGSTFRDKLPTVRKYKGQRQKTLRPLLLSKLREWVLENLDSEFTQPREDGENIECDDRIEVLSSQGYAHYRKHNWFSTVCLSSDKDSTNSSKYLINPDTHSGADNPLKGQFKFPQAMLIEATDRDVGGVELVAKANSKELKGYGFLYLMYQSALGKDGADNYSALSHLDRGFDFGDIAAYKVLKPCKTAKEALQATINVFAELLPFGVQYTDCHGVDHDVPTLEYMNTYFLIAYMNRTMNDQMSLYKLCKAMKVDTSAIEDNNKYSPPVKTYIGNESHVKSVEELIEGILKVDMIGLKAKKKADQAVVLDSIKEKLLSISFDSHFEMQSKLKEGFSDTPKVVCNKNKRSLKEFIKEFNDNKGYDNSPEGMHETFIESVGEFVHEEDSSEHRWYCIRDTVYRVIIDKEARFFKTQYYYMTGDSCASDMDLDPMNIDDVIEVYPEQVITTVYK